MGSYADLQEIFKKYNLDQVAFEEIRELISDAYSEGKRDGYAEVQDASD